MMEQAPYRLFEDLTSPYSAKVRAYLCYRGIRWRRMRVTLDTYLQTIPKLVGFPILPVILAPDDRVMQDSTPTLQWFEAHHTEGPCTVPDDPRLAFLAWLVEDFADEYAVRFSMHFRWGSELNRRAMSHRIARRLTFGVPNARHDQVAAFILKRQTGFDAHLGLTPATRPDLEAQCFELLAILERHFGDWQFLFGDRPSVADFALYGQLWAHLYMDPASAVELEVRAPRTIAWLDTLTELGDSRGEVGQTVFGNWLSPAPLPDTLRDLLRLIGETHVPNAVACATASVAREKTYTVTLRGVPTTFSTHHYRAWSFEQVQRAYLALGDTDLAWCRAELDATGIEPLFNSCGLQPNGLYDGLTPPFVVDGIGDARVRGKREKGLRGAPSGGSR